MESMLGKLVMLPTVHFFRLVLMEPNQQAAVRIFWQHILLPALVDGGDIRKSRLELGLL